MENKKFIITSANVQEQANKISTWIKLQVKEANAKGVVLGMSGGIDCSTVARLCQEGNVNIHLILMPYGENVNCNDAMELINKFNFDFHTFNIKPVVDALKISKDKSKYENIQLAEANILPRVRMTYLYQYAQLNNLLVIGTGNLSERTVGYFTKWGDGACDINPLANVTKTEVYLLANYLKIPNCIINKEPSAELWNGQTDEEELGISYEKIDKYIFNGTSGDVEIDKKIQEKNSRNMHKVKSIPLYND